MELPVNHRILVWARETIGYDSVTAAEKLRIHRNKMQEWERGDSTPALIQLEKLYDLYQQPIVVFFKKNASSYPQVAYGLPDIYDRPIPAVIPQDTHCHSGGPMETIGC
jgi:hypothetical protein